MPIQKTCLQCGADFRCKPKEVGRKFCGHACYRAYEAIHGRPGSVVPRVDFVCVRCGTPFDRTEAELRSYRKKFNQDPKYCSRHCSGKGRMLSDDKWQVHCIQCGAPMPIQRRPKGTINHQKKLCSTACRAAFRSERYLLKHPDVPTTRREARNGYWYIYLPSKPGRPPRIVFEHRYVMEQHIGRRLTKDETVHHVNGLKYDNRLENLELFDSRHGPGQRVVDKVAWAIQLLTDYRDFARDAGFELVAVEVQNQSPKLIRA